MLTHFTSEVSQKIIFVLITVLENGDNENLKI